MPLPKFLVLVIVFFFSNFCTCSDTITSIQFINDPGAIISNGNIFKLGFFSPGNTTNRYVGIVHVFSGNTEIWVANRERPLNDSAGAVTISQDGNLVVLDGWKNIIWSSNVTNSLPNSSAQILDSGNLVLRDNSTGRIIWESFKHPVDSCLQDMRLGTNINTNERQLLTSWKSASDPSLGKFSAGLVPQNLPQFVIWNGNDVHWRSGPWNGQIFIGIPDMYSVYLDGFHIVDDREGLYTLSFTYADQSFQTYYLLNYEGKLVQKSWFGEQGWEDTWLAQTSKCDAYGKCGSFGKCDSRESPVCTCLQGFEPHNMKEWGEGNWTGGCVRRTQLKCERNNSISEKGREDGFLRIGTVKVPDSAEWSNALEEDCRGECLSNCSCSAYAFYTGIGCMKWRGSLIDIQKFQGSAGVDIYLRVAFSELDQKGNRKVVIAVTVAIGSIIIAACMYFSWKWMTKKRGSKLTSELHGEPNPEYSNEIERRAKLAELPLFTFGNLEIATERFHSSNMLGQGGFGPVYRGKLPDGQEIAVKRLSRSSGQGVEEFMNEVVVISKLQHRNLVRILGCCVENEEKMLVYEYMPNRSLDALLFDPPGKEHLTWSTRVNIIEGIGRGLMYLHRDSRLRIIHRDLKASNILLDDDLNPKISDFGMARIFGGNQDQANTGRVVGTLGYMAPEYAMDGRFSEKSDVYSFGVLLLEIVSGRRISSFYLDEGDLSLLGFAWNSWSEKKMEELIDPRLSEACSQKEISRYTQVGLLCVQDLTRDRPSVSMVLSMLSSEIVDLPTPKQPVFTQSQISSGIDSQQILLPHSVNNLTNTILEGR